MSSLSANDSSVAVTVRPTVSIHIIDPDTLAPLPVVVALAYRCSTLVMRRKAIRRKGHGLSKVTVPIRNRYFAQLGHSSARPRNR